MSFEQDLTFLASVGPEGVGKTAADRKEYTSLGHSCFLAVALRSSTISLPGSEQRPKGPLLPAPGNSPEMELFLTVPCISSHCNWCWLCIALIRRTVKALHKAQYGSLKTLKCHSTCFRQELFFVFKGERGLLYIRQSPLIWAFTGEQKPMMQFFLLRISIRNLDLAPVRSFESNWEMGEKSWCRRRDFWKWKNLSLKRKPVVIPYNLIANQKGQ